MKGITIGYTSGVFDLFHIGHLNILKNAKAMCDKLIVGVTTDELMLEYKKKKTVIPFHERMEIVGNIKCVDAVIAQETMDKFKIWEKIKFDIMVVGDDWYNSEKWKEYEMRFTKLNVKIVFFPYTKGTSSTIINNTLNQIRSKRER